MTLDPVTPEVAPEPVMTLTVTPEVHRRPMAPRGAQAERVTWAMGQPGVASVSAIMTRWGVSESTAKRHRVKATDLVSNTTRTPLGHVQGGHGVISETRSVALTRSRFAVDSLTPHRVMMALTEATPG